MDNRDATCPARMADARLFSDWRPRCALAHDALRHAPIGISSHDARQFLIHHAEKLMHADRVAAHDVARCGPCVTPWKQGTMLPEREQQVCNARTCSMSVTNAQGLGLGRQYGYDEDYAQQEALFVARKEAEQARLFTSRSAPVPATAVGGEDVYPYPAFGRLAIPGGGVVASENAW
jgi:hypothetical protein